MTCVACQRAERHPRTAERTAGCLSCKARMLAAIGAGNDSAELKKITPEFDSALESLFGADRREGTRLTREWITKIKNEKPK